MTNREYFQQAIALDQKITSHLKESEHLREMSISISAPALGDRVQTSPLGEAPYVRIVEKLIAMEDKINAEIDALVDLKEEIGTVIDRLPKWEEQVVMRYHYLCGMTWEQISAETGIAIRSVYRWHQVALRDATQPEKIFSEI